MCIRDGQEEEIIMEHEKTFVGNDMFITLTVLTMGFPGGSEGKASACNGGDLGSIPGSEDPLEKEMAAHSSILAWRIPWTEKPGGLQSTGQQRVGHDRATSLHL